MGINSASMQTLTQRVRREVDQGLLPSAQFALAYKGELVAFETFGDATNDTRYVVYSATKAFVAGAVWALIGDGSIEVNARVGDLIPEFATNEKGDITIEQVMLHTSGFPHAPLQVRDGDSSAGRRDAFAKWRLNWLPGTRFEYHPSSAHWVLAELIETVTGQDYRDVVADRVSTPAGLQRVLGNVSHCAAELTLCGAPATPDELEAALGVRELELGEVTSDALMGFNDPEVQRVGMPGGGGVMRAADLALYYQAVLHNPQNMWDAAVLMDVKTNVRNRFPDLMGIPANRTLGLIQAGADGMSGNRGMGRTVSAATIGHNGAKGQIAWGDPVSGLSFAYCTNGLDENFIREGRRTIALGSLAGVCAGT